MSPTNFFSLIFLWCKHNNDINIIQYIYHYQTYTNQYHLIIKCWNTYFQGYLYSTHSLQWAWSAYELIWRTQFGWFSHHKENNFHELWITVNSLWPSDAIRRQETESTLAKVMACCLMAPSHYLNQCWLIINKVLWHSPEGIIMRRSEDTNQWNKIENYIFRITFRSPRGQWVKMWKCRMMHDKEEMYCWHWTQCSAVLHNTVQSHCNTFSNQDILPSKLKRFHFPALKILRF